ncbi:MAG TPA: 4'-phosphopantetheinyl transferase superfamily protein [bacterium]|nr:4'-phosphopantetheinyl transferase superfamily protein [bacterium]
MSAVESTVWTEPSTLPAPEPGEIHLWRISLASQLDEDIRLKKLLSSEELDQAGCYRFVRDQRRFIIRRAVLRQLLAACLATSPLAVRLELGVHGKPIVSGQADGGDLRFNCSHSGDWALVALARGIELGVDLEQHQPMSDAADVAKKFFTTAEINELNHLPSALKTAGFFNCWTRKEAFVKALGLGLSYPLNRFVVSLSPEKPAALLAVTDDPAALEKWSMISLKVVPEYSAALVFEGKSAALKYFAWNRGA